MTDPRKRGGAMSASGDKWIETGYGDAADLAALGAFWLALVSIATAVAWWRRKGAVTQPDEAL